MPEPPGTGDPAVDAAMRALADGVRAAGDGSGDGDGRWDGEARVAVFEAAHRALQDRLADVEG